jgi:hypothetical protein
MSCRLRLDALQCALCLSVHDKYFGFPAPHRASCKIFPPAAFRASQVTADPGSVFQASVRIFTLSNYLPTLARITDSTDVELEGRSNNSGATTNDP